MFTTCPKCQHQRQPNETAPDWQCPVCGVAYVKVADAGRNSVPASGTVHPASVASESGHFSWGKLVLLVVLIYGAWTGVQVALNKDGAMPGIGASISGNVSAAELTALSAKVQAGEVVMYTTTHCPYCAQARSWLNRYGFVFTECDAEASVECAQQLQALGGDGVPYLIVKGHHMKDGFDSEEFVVALQ